MMRQTQSSTQRQKGFSVIEMIVVIVIIGIVILIVAPRFLSTGNTAKATHMISAAQGLAQRWALIVHTCKSLADVSKATTVFTTGTTASPETALSLLVEGTNAAPCAEAAEVTHAGDIQIVRAGEYQVEGYKVTIGSVTVARRPYFAVQYANVPKALADLIYQQHTQNSGVLPTTAATATATATGTALGAAAGTITVPPSPMGNARFWYKPSTSSGDIFESVTLLIPS